MAGAGSWLDTFAGRRYSGKAQQKQEEALIPPKTPQEFYSFIVKGLYINLYQAVTTQARRKRLTEHDIALIEHKAIAIAKEALDLANEFKTFEIEPQLAMALNEINEFCASIRVARIEEIAKER